MTRYSSRLLSVALCGLASMTVVRANCSPQETFGQSGVRQYHYVVFPPGTPATSESIVGRFWQPGHYQATNQGACDESRWLLPCNGDCPGVTANPAFWIYGAIGSNECQAAGCIADEIILLLEERGSGGLFAIARVDDSAGLFLYDFSRLGRDIGLTSIPRPIATSAQYIGSSYRVGFRFDVPRALPLRRGRDDRDHRSQQLLSWRGLPLRRGSRSGVRRRPERDDLPLRAVDAPVHSRILHGRLARPRGGRRRTAHFS
jgi:hypothetical protein